MEAQVESVDALSGQWRLRVTAFAGRFIAPGDMGCTRGDLLVCIDGPRPLPAPLLGPIEVTQQEVTTRTGDPPLS